MPRIDNKTKKIMWIGSVSLAVLTVVVAYFIFGRTMFEEFTFFAIIIAVLPSAVLSYMDFKWRNAIDEHLPDLFRSIVQAQQTGMTLPQAIEENSKRNYGPLTAELRKMTAQMSWGMSFEEALLAMGKRVNTVLVQRTIPMIIEASQSGGHVEKVFDPMGRFIQSTLLLQKERRAQTRPYIAIIYVAFFVFIFTVILLFKSFFMSVEGLPILGTAVMAPTHIQQLFFHMMAIQALFGGLVAGKMGEGTIAAGYKHVVVLMVCGYVALKFFM